LQPDDLYIVTALFGYPFPTDSKKQSTGSTDVPTNVVKPNR
jgi:hypothetical protein